MVDAKSDIFLPRTAISSVTGGLIEERIGKTIEFGRVAAAAITAASGRRFEAAFAAFLSPLCAIQALSHGSARSYFSIQFNASRSGDATWVKMRKVFRRRGLASRDSDKLAIAIHPSVCDVQLRASRGVAS